jgi:D-3-phosphoglycerate dehydrogenase
MSMNASPETLELLAWISSRARTYDEAIEAWRSHCPRLAVWDDAFSDGLLRVVRNGRTSHVALTSLGRAALQAS